MSAITEHLLKALCTESLVFPPSLTPFKARSQYLLFGTADNTSVATDPSWNCLVDGVNISPRIYDFGPGVAPGNSYLLCNADSLADGEHTIALQMIGIDSGRTFWFDSIFYAPSASVPLDNATVYIDPTDPAIVYGSGWEPLPDMSQITRQNGAKMTLDFVGIQLSWFAMISHNFSSPPGPATYSIDGGTPISFLVPGSSPVDRYNQLFFQTPQLSPGKHHFEVTYDGNEETTPLSLTYLVIRNATVPGSLSASGTPAGAVSSASSTSASSGSPKITDSAANSRARSGAIVGGVIGGVAGGIVAILALTVLLFFFRRRSRKREEIKDRNALDLGVALPVIEPFTAVPSRRAMYQHHSSSSGWSVPGQPVPASRDLPQTRLSRESSLPSPLLKESPTINPNYVFPRPRRQTKLSTSSTRYDPSSGRAFEKNDPDSPSDIYGAPVSTKTSESSCTLR
ncbi:hypothetical protein GALMADRAFT_146165 [Galerina marginata CBS 339.88]|uniref:Mid2 domain-containing protein n=1 Tax=Galerina marginata (strain CBS 339.88) TaxID=685588 RepID=A0A067SP17_GALM3|nr:hypothetical protein GALMADRAFT_146165 [Galerina marginata CBS 339.88]